MALLAWIVVATAGLMLVTQAPGAWNNRIAIALQSFTVPLTALTAAAAGVGVALRSAPLTAVAVTVLVGCVALVRPVVRRRRAAPPNADGLRVLHANLLYLNGRHAREAAEVIASQDADVLVLTEFTPHHEQIFKELLGDEYPHRVGIPSPDAGGIGCWSRTELAGAEMQLHADRPATVAVVKHRSGDIRVIGVHPIAPTTPHRRRDWAPGVAAADAAGRADGPPTVIVGDWNATRWHPPLRALLGNGWRDAHEVLGRGLSASWPIGSYPPYFPLMRLDHALIDGRLDAVAVSDFDTPGSDHRGFVVTVARR
jgi:Endonuclease/Exonuclease/phosphatase family